MVKISSYDFDEGPGGAGTGGVLGVLRGLLKTKILVAHFFLFVCFKVSKENLVQKKSFHSGKVIYNKLHTHYSCCF